MHGQFTCCHRLWDYAQSCCVVGDPRVLDEVLGVALCGGALGEDGGEHHNHNEGGSGGNDPCVACQG